MFCRQEECCVANASGAQWYKWYRMLSNALQCSRMLSNVRNAIECSLLLSLVCRKSRNSKVVALAAVLLTSERSQLSCTQAVTRNVWGRILQRLKSIATFDIWKRVFEFNNQLNSQCKAGVTLSNIFFFISLLSFFLSSYCAYAFCLAGLHHVLLVNELTIRHVHDNLSFVNFVSQTMGA